MHAGRSLIGYASRLRVYVTFPVGLLGHKQVVLTRTDILEDTPTPGGHVRRLAVPGDRRQGREAHALAVVPGPRLVALACTRPS